MKKVILLFLSLILINSCKDSSTNPTETTGGEVAVFNVISENSEFMYKYADGKLTILGENMVCVQYPVDNKLVFIKKNSPTSLSLCIANFDLSASQVLFTLDSNIDNPLYLSYDKRYVFYAVYNKTTEYSELIRYTISDKSKKVLISNLDKYPFICPSPTADKIAYYGSESTNENFLHIVNSEGKLIKSFPNLKDPNWNANFSWSRNGLYFTTSNGEKTSLYLFQSDGTFLYSKTIPDGLKVGKQYLSKTQCFQVPGEKGIFIADDNEGNINICKTNDPSYSKVFTNIPHDEYSIFGGVNGKGDKMAYFIEFPGGACQLVIYDLMKDTKVFSDTIKLDSYTFGLFCYWSN